MFKSILNFFNSAYKRFKRVIKNIFKDAMGKFIAEVWDFVLEIVSGLEEADFTNDEKRQQAFDIIRVEALKRGLEYKNNWIHLAITLVIASLRKEF